LGLRKRRQGRRYPRLRRRGVLHRRAAADHIVRDHEPADHGRQGSGCRPGDVGDFRGRGQLRLVFHLRGLQLSGRRLTVKKTDHPARSDYQRSLFAERAGSHARHHRPAARFLTVNPADQRSAHDGRCARLRARYLGRRPSLGVTPPAAPSPAAAGRAGPAQGTDRCPPGPCRTEPGAAYVPAKPTASSRAALAGQLSGRP